MRRTYTFEMLNPRRIAVVLAGAAPQSKLFDLAHLRGMQFLSTGVAAGLVQAHPIPPPTSECQLFLELDLLR